jgi:HEAT repeat protein
MKLRVTFLLLTAFGLVTPQALCQAQRGAQGGAAPPNISADAGGHIKGLSSADPVVRADSACALGKMGSSAAQAVPHLIRLLGDAERVDPKHLCPRGIWDDQSGQPEFQQSKEASPGEAATHALILIGEPAVEPLIAALRDDLWIVRKNAAWALAELRDARAAEPLIAALKDQAWQVRAHAAVALGEQRGAAVAEPLIAALKDESPNVRWFAAASLGQLRDARSVEPLIKALGDENVRVRTYSAASLGQLRDERSILPLVAALRDSHPQVRMYAAASLGQLRDRRAIEPLTEALKDEHSQVRMYARDSLNQIKP